MVKCEQCGKKINYIITNSFNYDGSDSDITCQLSEYSDHAVVIDTDTMWSGWGLNEIEQRECIRCPYCDQFPFKHNEIQVEEHIKVIMFKQIDNG